MELVFKETNTCGNYFASIHMAGPIEQAKNIASKWTLKGQCVQFTEVEYVYTGGRERGFVARFINYPRFPKQEYLIYQDAKELAILLAKELGQMSFTIETSMGNDFYCIPELKK
ncbi:hypothetical protein ZPAH1_orf00398 [Aeromonas phage ZPAH1]|nr:hypothetical protein ASwh1_353 [Aeromonas phage Aswh_1]QQG34160.1 hypothetical protein ZPAH1_orf00398 [Aeromonas phage ZPAH1]